MKPTREQILILLKRLVGNFGAYVRAVAKVVPRHYVWLTVDADGSTEDAIVYKANLFEAARMFSDIFEIDEDLCDKVEELVEYQMRHIVSCIVYGTIGCRVQEQIDSAIQDFEFDMHVRLYELYGFDTKEIHNAM